MEKLTSFPPPLSSGATTYSCSVCGQTRTQATNPWSRWDAVTNLFVCSVCYPNVVREGKPASDYNVGIAHPSVYQNAGTPAAANGYPANKLKADGTHAYSTQNEVGQSGNPLQNEANPVEAETSLLAG